MARYYSTVEGTGYKPATKTGTPASGLSAHISGWNIGASIELRPDPSNPKLDRLIIRLTGGSNSPSPVRDILILTEPS
jgi:hypothetical protein